MMTLRELLSRTHENLLVLQEREAKHGGNAPVDLLNEISDHLQAIELIEPALSTELTETGLKELKEALRPLLLNPRYVQQLDPDQLKLEKPRLSFEPETILIPAGPFLMGSPPGPTAQPEETPQHELYLPAYRIGRFPVTNEAYLEFVKQTGRSVSPETGWKLAKVGKAPAADKLNHPVVGVSWDEALAYCRWLQEQTERPYRLPTEAEWEKAARGSQDPRLYPWGDEWQDDRCNHGGTQTTGVDTYPVQREHGSDPNNAVYDMVGNVWEWTSTLWGNEYGQPDFRYPYHPDDGRESLEANPLHREYRICRGGSYLDEPSQLRCSVRLRATADEQSAQGGFRVVMELE